MTEKILALLNKHPDLLLEWDAEVPTEIRNGIVGFHAKSTNTIMVWVEYDDCDETYSVRIEEQEYGMQIQVCFIPNEQELLNVMGKMIKGEIGEDEVLPLQEKWIAEALLNGDDI